MPHTAQTLLKAARLPFLVITPLCLSLGVALMRLQGGEIVIGELLLVLLGALLVHVAVNGFNEYFDFRSGLDLLTRRTLFSGGSGALPAQPLAGSAVLIMALACLLAASLIGLWFVQRSGGLLLLLCLAGAFIAVAYSPLLNRNALACYLAPGLGFGPILILGTLLALGGQPDGLAVLVAAAAGLWISQLLLVNQVPDEQPDRAVGRRHLVVIWGRSGAMEFSLVPLVLSLIIICMVALMLGDIRVLLALFPAMGLWLLAFRAARRPLSSADLGLNLVLVLLALLGLLMGLILAL